MIFQKPSIILFLFYIIGQAQGTYITFDTGDASLAVYLSKECRSDTSPQKATINFSGTFLHTPQFVAYLEKYDSEWPPIKFQYSTSQLTQTMAEISISCSTAKSIYTLNYFWIAFDDTRITVIDSGVIDTSTKSSETFLNSHNNIYATTAFLILQGFGFSGAFDFSLKVTSVTDSQVEVAFTNNNQNLLQVDYVLVIGPAESFTVKQISTGTITQSSPYSQVLNLVTDCKLLVPCYGMKWTQTSEFPRYKVTFDTSSSTTITYQQTTWDGAQRVDRVDFSEVWFNMKNYRAIFPFLCAKMRITKKIQYAAAELQLQITDSSKTYTYKQGSSDIFYLDPNPDTITWNLYISLPCQYPQQINGYVLKSTDQEQNVYDVSTQCYGKINLIEYRIKLTQTLYTYQQITVTVTTTKIQITQWVLVPQSTILLLELNDPTK